MRPPDSRFSPRYASSSPGAFHDFFSAFLYSRRLPAPPSIIILAAPRASPSRCLLFSSQVGLTIRRHAAAGIMNVVACVPWLGGAALLSTAPILLISLCMSEAMTFIDKECGLTLFDDWSKPCRRGSSRWALTLYISSRASPIQALPCHRRWRDHWSSTPCQSCSMASC